MGWADDLRVEVKEIYKTKWNLTNGSLVPDSDRVRLAANDAVKLDATVLYADLAESTNMVDSRKKHFAAEVYKAYLVSACRVIRQEGGEITAFDGDRVMAVYVGDSKNTSAAKSALMIKWVVQEIVDAELKRHYNDSSHTVKHAVGVDTSELWVAKTGIRGSNDLVWVGRAANYAAKLCSLRAEGYASWLTGEVYSSMNKSIKFSSNGKPMWEETQWAAMKGMTVYRSSWRWKPD